MPKRHIFSAKNFAGLIRAGDPRAFDVNISKQRKQLIEDAISASNDYTTLEDYKKAHIGGKSCVIYTKYSQNLLIRAISRHIKWRFNLSPRSRDSIVRSVISTLKEGTPFYVYRRDISSFYENIPINYISERTISNHSVPRNIREHLKKYLEAHAASGSGLARGAALSAILAELAMQEFDRSLKRIEGIFRYYRFADDIIAFSTQQHSDFDVRINEMLPGNLTLNAMKSADCDFHNPSTKQQFDYLGYSFSAPGGCSKFGRTVNTDVSENKIKRIKSRVALSFRDFQANKNFNLLRKRLSYLCANFQVLRAGKSWSNQSSSVWSGIYYNYHLCGTHQAAKFTQAAPSGIKKIDQYYQFLLRSSKSRFFSSLSSLTAAEKQQLIKLSFRAGFEERITVKLKPEEINRVKSIWHLT